MNWPNRITVIRLLLTPIFIVVMVYYKNSPDVEWLRYFALFIFIVAVATDVLDGFIARMFNQQTMLGTILDPLADKILLTSSVIILTLPIESIGYRFPYWFTTLIITRDVMIVLGSFFVHFLIGNVTIKVHLTGKLTTFFLILTILWVLMKFPSPIYLISLTSFFTVLSGINYLLAGSKQLNTVNA